MLKISIVMPVYNTPTDFFRAAVDSVLNQSYGNFELIIVDDGSCNECAELCDLMGNKDNRIRVIHQKNAGVSAARNNGTSEADGDYVMYVDSDDILSKDALSEGIEAIEKTAAEFVFAGVQHIKTAAEFRPRNDVSAICPKKYEGKDIDIVRRSFLTQRNREYLNINNVGSVIRGPVARLLKTQIAKNVCFDNRLILGEDVEWNMRVLNACNSVCYVNSVWYGYIVYSTSSLRKYYGNRAQMLENYHRTLYRNNKEFCDRNLDAYALNMAVTFYAMIGFEYMADECPLTGSEKRKEIKSILRREPWTLLQDKKILSGLPLRYKGFIKICNLGYGVTFLKVWEALKSCRK